MSKKMFGKKGIVTSGKVICVTGSLTVKSKRSRVSVIVNKNSKRDVI